MVPAIGGNKNIQRIAMQPVRQCLIGNALKIMELINSRFKTLPHSAPVITAGAIGHDLKIVAVMMLQNAGQQMGTGMVAERFAQITDADFVTVRPP